MLLHIHLHSSSHKNNEKRTRTSYSGSEKDGNIDLIRITKLAFLAFPCAHTYIELSSLAICWNTRAQVRMCFRHWEPYLLRFKIYATYLIHYHTYSWLAPWVALSMQYLPHNLMRTKAELKWIITSRLRWHIAAILRFKMSIWWSKHESIHTHDSHFRKW